MNEKEWADWEIKILKEQYLLKGTDIPELSHRSKNAIRKKARKIGISVPLKCTTDRVNETRIMNNGLKAKIIAYRNANDIDVMFENGIIKKSTYHNFEIGRIKNPDLAIDENGIQYKSVVEMCKARHISTSRYYTMLRKGYDKKYIFAELSQNKKGPYVGQESKMFCGMRCQIKTVYSDTDIDVEFQDGSILNHITYKQYQQRNLRPNTFVRKRYDEFAKKRIGEEFKVNDGLIATIIEYKSSRNITIVLSNGEMYYKQRYYNLKNGIIRKRQSYPDVIIGETRLMKCGLNATLIAFKDRNNVDIKFETGQIVKNRRFNDFIRGVIGVPNIGKSHIGEVLKMNCGLYTTITAYNNSRDIKAMFEDGSIVANKAYSSFCRRSLGHQTLKPNKSGYLGCIKVIKPPLWLEDGNPYYTCECQICRHQNCWNPQQMLTHIRGHEAAGEYTYVPVIPAEES